MLRAPEWHRPSPCAARVQVAAVDLDNDARRLRRRAYIWTDQRDCASNAALTARLPIAWLRFEPLRSNSVPEPRLTCWPGGEDILLAAAHPRGSQVTSLASTSHS